MPKEIIYDEQLRKRMLFGVDLLANAVKPTMGPKGRNAVLQRPGFSPLITNDGATIAKEIELQDTVANIGAQIIKEAASKTNDIAGDGTTTAVVLAQYIIKEGAKNIAAGASPAELKKGIQGATQLVAAAIKKLAKPANTKDAISQVAAVSAKDADIGNMIAQAMEKVGTAGLITVEESHSMYTTLSVTEGMQFEKGYLSPEMATDKEKMVAELDNPYILVTDRKITSSHELVPLMEQIIPHGRPLLIIAESVEGEALGVLMMNKTMGVLCSVAVHPPAYGDGRRARMEDIALLTGGVFISEELGYTLRDATADMLGSADSVKAGRKSTAIINGHGNKDAVRVRAEYLKALIEKTEYDFDKKQLKERLAKLVSGVAVIKVGAATEVEMKEKRDRTEDALSAARAAVAEGIVPGGGGVYLNIVPAVRAYVESLSGDRKTGAEIIMKALEEPARQIAENAGMDGSAVIAEIKHYPAGVGFDVAAEQFTDMLEAGVVDSAKVARLAILNASSVSAILLTAEATVIDIKE